LESFFYEIDRNQKSGFAIDYDFLDSADCARDDRRFASHCFEVDDAEWFVNRRTAKDRRVRIQLDHGRPIEHFFDPKNVLPFLLRSGDRFLHFLTNLWRVGRACAKHDWKIFVHELNRTDEMNDSLLSRDPADKKQIRLLG